MTHHHRDLWAQVKKFPFQEFRAETDLTFEAVVTAEKLSSLGTVLEGYFGPPLKPAGEPPSKEVQQMTDQFGGIRKEQTLFYSAHGEKPVLGMFWPWSDGKLVTLKMYVMNEPLKSKKSGFWEGLFKRFQRNSIPHS